MSNGPGKRLSDLAAAQSLDDDDLVYVVRDGKSWKMEGTALREGLVRHVADMAALRAIKGMQPGQAVEVVTTGRAGLFRWDSSDLSAEVAADTQMGIYVPPTGQDGSSGAWVRVYSGLVNAQWFGAVGDGITDDTVALQAFLDSGGGGIRATGAHYLVTTTLILPSGIRLVGQGGKAKIKLAAGVDKTLISAQGVSHITLESLELDASQGEQNSGKFYGLYLEGCQHVLLRDVYSHHAVYPPVRLNQCSDIYTENLDISHSPADGLKVTKCTRGTFINTNVWAVPHVDPHATIGAVAGVQVDDGSSNLTFVQVTCTSDASRNAVMGLDFSSHTGEPPVTGVRVFGLKTEGCGIGLAVQSASEDVSVYGHVSVNDRIGASINTCNRVLVEGFDYVGGTHTYPGTRYGIGVEGSPKNVTFRSGKISKEGNSIYLGNTVTDCSGILFEDMDVFSTTTGGLWARFSSSSNDIDVTFSRVKIAGSGSGVVALIAGSGYTFSKFKLNFAECEFVENPDSTNPIVRIYAPNVTIRGGKVDVDLKDPFRMESTAKNIVLDGVTVTGQGSRQAIVLMNGFEGLTVSGCQFNSITHVLLCNAGASDAPIRNVKFFNNQVRNIGSGVYRINGETDEIYVENFLWVANDYLDCPTRWMGWPLGSNASNIEKFAEMPDEPFPT